MVAPVRRIAPTLPREPPACSASVPRPCDSPESQPPQVSADPTTPVQRVLDRLPNQGHRFQIFGNGATGGATGFRMCPVSLIKRQSFDPRLRYWEGVQAPYEKRRTPQNLEFCGVLLFFLAFARARRFARLVPHQRRTNQTPASESAKRGLLHRKRLRSCIAEKIFRP
mgnify:CR=1 FL=1